MKSHLKKVCLVGVVVCIWIHTSLAEGQLLFIGEENVPPYSYMENGQKKGTDYDLIQEVAKRMKIQININFTPWKRMKVYVEKGRCDAGFTMFYVKEREKFGIYARPPLHYSTYSVFVKKGHEFPFSSVRDLYGKTVGNVRGYKIGEGFDKAVAEGRITVEVVSQKKQNIKKLAAGRMDCFVSHRDTTLAAMKEMGFSDVIVPLPKPIKESKEAFLVFSKAGKNIADKEEFVKKFGSVLEEMKQDGTFQKIYDKYLK
ncbi:MAG: transporter substrate-binding domain-containing protein [Desulfobacterales bacterium]|nr:transporter substrate-binding domain-containing protein [Desulfobacterales bacterium]